MTAISDYLKKIESDFQRGNATELTHRRALETLLESFPGITATNEPKRSDFGAPDFDISKPDKYGPLTIGYIETKDVGASLGPVARSEQLKRYLRAIDNLILSDYLEFRWYVDGKLRLTASLGNVGANNKITRQKDGGQQVEALLQSFLAHAPQPVDNPRELAERMARLTHMIRDIIVEAFEQGQPSELLADWREAFSKVLIAGLDQPEQTVQFADMIAQTIAYGLFSARIMDDTPGFTRQEAQSLIPRTNPFLRNFFEQITGNALDEEPFVGFVDDLVQLLAHAEIKTILAHFGKRTRQEDPIVHFYETFLATYDPKLRESRGVYFTPEPVVSYIVRSVDHILKTRFNLPDGLADTSTVKYEYQDDTPERVTIQAEAPKVLVLDPAVGTATFLYAVIDLIRDHFMQSNNAGMWSGFVRDHLLPRLFGFELLMAPYAVAHLKLGMQLAGQDLDEPLREKWKYDFASDDRLGIYLTNTLEKADRKIEGLFGPMKLLSDEASAANKVKRDMPIMVVLGNPPYSGHSSNRSWINKNVDKGESYFSGWKIDSLGRAKLAYRTAKEGLTAEVPTFIGELIRDYFIVDGDWLGERNPKWLQDDYVKFIRWAQWRIERSGVGILAFITNHGYLSAPTFRGMRQSLTHAFNEIYILDLHGSTKKGEASPDGSQDQNVFDILPGVSIAILVKYPNHETPAKVNFSELWGHRKTKYNWLLENDVATVNWQEVEPLSPFYLFNPQDVELLTQYNYGWRLPDMMPENVLGFQTHRDHFAIAFDSKTIAHRVGELVNKNVSTDSLRSKYKLRDNQDWQLSRVRIELQNNPKWQSPITICAYRPFDSRWCYFSAEVIDRPRPDLAKNVLQKNNLSLLASRQQATSGFRHVWVANQPANDCVVSATSREANQVFYQYVYPKTNDSEPKPLFNTSPWPPGKDGRTPNLSEEFVNEFAGKLSLAFVSDGKGDLKKSFGPEDIFNYAYAVFHCPTYRVRYAEFLKIDFPRLPLTSDTSLFSALCALGGELVALHLLESPQVSKFITSYPENGSNEVAPRHPKYLSSGEPEPGTGEPLKAGRVYINAKQYFDRVPTEVWEFQVGGYQVCQKWLKDRKGRKLSHADLEHYQKVVVALHETIRLMSEIDAAIPAWPIE